MPELTRRRSADHREECWQIYFGDVHAGTITERVGNPHDTDQWEWSCGFYPDRSRVKSVPTPPRPSRRLAPTSSAHGRCFFFSKRTEADFR